METSTYVLIAIAVLLVLLFAAYQGGYLNSYLPAAYQHATAEKFGSSMGYSRGMY